MSLEFDPKDPEETITLSMNFRKLINGAPITACVFSVEDLTGSPVASMLEGVADFSADPIVRQKVKGGTNGTTYMVRAKVTTAAGVYVGSAFMLVRRGA